LSTNTSTPPVGATVLEVLDNFDVAPPSLVEERSLQQRVDRKYLLGIDDLEPLLARLRPGYCLLRAGQHVWARYESVYLDTLDRELYHAHRCGRRPRYKVRIRHHIDRQLTFLEIKRKQNNGHTVKLRLTLAFRQNHLDSRERLFIEAHTPLNVARLIPCVSISFQRLTLLGRGVNERLTLDRDLTVVAGARAEHISRVVIAEVKQSRYVHHGGAVDALRGVHAREAKLSKYCLGTILMAPVRANIFKPVFRTIERLSS
jgi:hypothetical protein